MGSAALTVSTGLVAGVLSGAFGIGGGLVTTPAIRVVLGYPALVAVGTPLVVILPTALAGAVSYSRRGMADVRVGITLGLSGGITSIAGAWLSDLIGGAAILLLTAVVIAYAAAVTVRDAITFGRRHRPMARVELGAPAIMAAGSAAGFYSGLLGLGGGFVLVPMLLGLFGMPAKRAIGTSLIAVTVLAVPGAAAHAFLGHVDLVLAFWLTLGVVPGALVGARTTAAADERVVRMAFAGVLLAAAAILAAGELGWTA